MKIPKNWLVWFRIILGIILVVMGIGMTMESAKVAEEIKLFTNTTPFGWYADFLKNGVVPNIGLFISLCIWGEILAGISLIFGLFTIIGSSVTIFMFLNYGLATAGTTPISLPGCLILIALLLTVAFSPRSKEFSIDQKICERVSWLRSFLS